MVAAETDARTGRGLVLVADRTQGLRDTVCNALAMSGNEFAVADTAAAVLAKLHAETFDVALIGLTIPGMQASKLIQEMKVLAPHLPIVVMAEASESHGVIEASHCGANTCLLKPFSDMRKILVVLAYAKALRHRDDSSPKAELRNAECEDCHVLFSFPEWRPQAKCPLCGSENTLIRIAGTNLDEVTSRGNADASLENDLRFARIAKWAGLITSTQLAECACRQWVSAESGKSVPPIDEIMINKGYMTNKHAVRIRKFQTVPRPEKTDLMFGNETQQRGLITAKECENALALQAEMTERNGSAPLLAEILLEKGTLDESAIQSIFRHQFNLRRKTPLQYFEIEIFSLSSFLDRAFRFRRRCSKEHVVAAILLLVPIVGIATYVVLKQLRTFEPRIRIIDQQGDVTEVLPGNIAATPNATPKPLFFALHCEECNELLGRLWSPHRSPVVGDHLLLLLL